MKKTLSAIIVLLFGIYILKLVFLNQLQLYINKQNIWYTTLAGCICCGIGLLALITRLNKRENKTDTGKENSIFSRLFIIPLFLALVVGLALPAKPIIFNSGNFFPITPPPYASKSVDDAVIGQLLGFNTQQYTFAQWYLVGSLSPDNHYQKGKPVDLTGQIFTIDPQHHFFYFGRLYITCCVVDARPYAFIVHYFSAQNAPNPYEPNEWLHIQGAFITENMKGQQDLAIVPLNIQPVAQPQEPYVN